MKKIVFSLMLCLLPMVMQAQNPSQPSVPNSETERLIDKYIDKTGFVIDNLAKKLEVPAEHVYYVLVKQQVVEAVVWLMALIVFSVMFFFSLRFCIKDDWDMAGFVFLCILLGIGVVVTLIGSLIECPTGFINPEYGAINRIMYMLQG